MIEIMRSNNFVELSLAQSLLSEAGIVHFLADQNMSILEGSLGVLPRRLMADRDRAEEARTILRDAGIDDVV
ncbi:MAG: DUF2007 domain-containing protein [Rhodobiaceae bacterium]|nr:DUF2007 domain-containing protein [Rhodobiaceae bacterium]